MAGGDRRRGEGESRRIAQPQRIFLRPASAEDYTQEYLVDLSMTGMFVRCMDPPAPGTLLEFKMKLSAGAPVARGSAEVVWRRQEKQRLSHPPGMGLRFTDVDAESRTLIQETVERYSRGPDGHLELQGLRSVVEETLGEILGPTAAREAGGPLFTTAPVSIADLPIPPARRSPVSPSPLRASRVPASPAEAPGEEAAAGLETAKGSEDSQESRGSGAQEPGRTEAPSRASREESREAAAVAPAPQKVPEKPRARPVPAAEPETSTSRRWWILAVFLLLGALAAAGVLLLG